jgi:hypothetical protein
MASKNPRVGEDARANASVRTDALSPTQNRPKIQATPAMRQRLALLLWCGRLQGGLRP